MVWRKVLCCAVIVLLLHTGRPLRADVFNIKVLSDNTPDLTDLPSFVASTTDNWPTNDQKARALAYWLFALGDQASSNHDWEPVEPILTLNNLPHPGFCAIGRLCSSPRPKEEWGGRGVTMN